MEDVRSATEGMLSTSQLFCVASWSSKSRVDELSRGRWSKDEDLRRSFPSRIFSGGAFFLYYHTRQA